MQIPLVMAFRKRLKNRCYTNISIYKLNINEYLVRAIDPLAKTRVERIYSLGEMNKLFK